MTPEQWQQVKEIFHSALDIAPERRAVFLDEACAGRDSLRVEVESLIRSHEEAGSFIDSPAYEVAAEFLMDDTAHSLIGELVGPYKIVGLLGKGGMGEVYLAEDMRLGRRVAMKLLPREFTKDVNRLRRFEQEARAASALNHPNILTIYEIGRAGASHFIATEFIDGETLRQRVQREGVEIIEAIDVAVQIASALAAAHKAGIIHRDIKPENVMLREDGLVKVLDFGLAKLAERLAITSGPETPTRMQINTAPGMIMGTANYMSPEQARGLEVDERTDIFSLGAVLYEMIAGRVPFEGETPSDVIASILKTEQTPLSHLSPGVPSELARIITKALRKDMDERYQDVRDMLLDLKSLKEELEFQIKLGQAVAPEASDAGEAATASQQTSQMITAESSKRTGEISDANVTASIKPALSLMKGGRRSIVLALAALVFVGLSFGLYKFFIKRSATVSQTETAPSESVSVLRNTQITYSPGLDDFPSLSPDGNSIAYSSDHSGSFEIYVKQLTAGGREIQLTSDGQQNLEPAWSPDGQHIAYYSMKRGDISIVPALGGVSKQLTEFGSHPAWSHDGSMIAFQSNAPLSIGAHERNAMPPSTIWVISSQGGTAKQITQKGNPAGGHGAPSWSPDGKRIVFTASDFTSGFIWSISVEGSELKKITSENVDDAIYSPDGGTVFYTARGGLWRVGVSQKTGEQVGEPVQVMGGGPTNIRHLTISANGKRMAYGALALSSNLWSVPLSPNSREATGPPAPFTHDTSARNNLARFSPDGRKIAFNKWRSGTSADIWVADADGNNLTQLTADPAIENMPSWFPDGNRIAFLSDRNNDRQVLWSTTLAGGDNKPLLDLGDGVEFANLSPDGRQVAFNSKKSGTINVWTVALEGGSPVQLTFDNELAGFPCWSPDGQFLAFEMKRGDDSYLAVMPSGGGAITQLTFDHGHSWPHDWAPDGDRIAFAGYRNGLWNIYWVSRTTKQQKQLTNYSKLNAYVRYPAWAPMGNQIVYEYAETTGNIWLMELR
ncbi:MAG: hypothetical protein AUG51_06805 [Acidobacteria bacterium 13_1_20CM_3_53_8]|nr:MAG: hypothetical protein AUG51_06805 [Acidobacteria bacterium 13_1_20CM_3_53_8]